MKVFDQTMNTLENSLNYSTTKNKTISNNIANIDTPNYTAQHVSFQSLLQKATNNLQLKNTNVRHLQKTNDPSSHHTRTRTDTESNHNSNNLEIDKETTNSAENQICHRNIIYVMNGKLQTMQNVVRGGK